MVAITVGSLAWVLWQVEVGRLATALVGFRPLAAVAAVAAWSGTLLLRTWRFGVLLPRRPRWSALLSVMSIGSLAMSVVPLRLGEFVRPWLLQDRHEVPFGESLAAVVVERLLDIVALLALLVVVGVTADVHGIEVGGVDLLAAGTAALATTAAVVLAGLVGLVALGERALDWIGRPLRAVAPGIADVVARQGGAFVDTSRALVAAPARLVGALASTAVLWVVSVGMMQSVLWGVDGVAPTAAMAATTWAACMLSMVLFPSPGFLGPFEAAGVASLAAQGVDPTLGGAAAVAVHAVLLGGYAVSGTLAALWEGTTLGEAVRRSSAGPT